MVRFRIRSSGFVMGLQERNYQAAQKTLSQVRRAGVIVTGISPEACKTSVSLVGPVEVGLSTYSDSDSRRLQRTNLMCISVAGFFKLINGINVQSHHVVK